MDRASSETKSKPQSRVSSVEYRSESTEERDVDELRAVLNLATEDELEILTEILFRRQFNPLDYVCAPHPLDVRSQTRDGWLDALEERFRFLAADGVTVLRGKTRQVSYRQVLIQICRYLNIPYSQTYSTSDLEEEIFLSLLNRAWQKLPPSEQQVLNGNLQQVVSQTDIAKHLPPSFQTDPASLILKGSGVLAINSLLRPWLLQQLARQFALYTARYQVAQQAARAGVTIANQMALQTASRGMALSAARYGAVRSVFTFLGPALWAWFFADLGWRAIATNYARVIPVVFTLAQIRLLRASDLQPA